MDAKKWLDEAGLLRCSSRGLDNAAEGGHLDVLKVSMQKITMLVFIIFTLTPPKTIYISKGFWTGGGAHARMKVGIYGERV